MLPFVKKCTNHLGGIVGFPQTVSETCLGLPEMIRYTHMLDPTLKEPDEVWEVEVPDGRPVWRYVRSTNKGTCVITVDVSDPDAHLVVHWYAIPHSDDEPSAPALTASMAVAGTGHRLYKRAVVHQGVVA